MSRIKELLDQTKKLYEEIKIIGKELKELEVTPDDLPTEKYWKNPISEFYFKIESMAWVYEGEMMYNGIMVNPKLLSIKANSTFNRLDGMEPISREEFEEATDKVYKEIKEKI